MKLPKTAHTDRPWRIHDVAPDFHLEDVWALPTPGGPDDLSCLVEQFAHIRFPEGAPPIVRFLWDARWKLGSLLGWERERTGIGSRVASLRDRLPYDLQQSRPGPDFDPFTSVYQLHDEWAAELANKTVHAILHLGWVQTDTGYRGQLAVLVKPNGLLGQAYMAAIKPLRYALVYPALLRLIERDWQQTPRHRTR